MPTRNPQARLRQLPKVDQLLLHDELTALRDTHGHSLAVEAVQQAIQESRTRLLANDDTVEVSAEAHVARATEIIREVTRPTPVRVINATGIIVNTGLGRSLMSKRAAQRMFEAATRHCALEVDVASGERGVRDANLSALMRRLTKAEAAIVVNNNAGALLIALNALAEGKEVIVSRGELVEIGGSFRIPDVMKKSGCKLVEVGTTNKTRASDYAEAITENTGLLLKAHTSNFRIVGFHEEVSLAELVQLGAKHNVPVMEDLGSGAFIDVSRYGIQKEPLVQESVAAGADVVTFSGDKLLGGPQAGLIVGRQAAIQKIRKNALYRALRCDKTTIAALEETLRTYFDPAQAIKEIPTLAAIAAPVKEVERKAKKLLRKLGALTSATFTIERGQSQVGGGALPTEFIETRLVAIRPQQLGLLQVARLLRVNDAHCVFARVQNDAVLLDLRTVLDDEIAALAETVEDALTS